MRARLDNLQLELSAVEPALGDLGSASLARHGVHDVHRAHYLSNSPTSTIARGLVGQTSTRGRSSSKATRHFWPSQSSVAVC